jgi:hypothetical protein
MTNESERTRKEAVMTEFEVHLTAVTSKSTKNLSACPLSGPRFEHGTCQIGTRNANHRTDMFSFLNAVMLEYYWSPRRDDV